MAKSGKGRSDWGLAEVKTQVAFALGQETPLRIASWFKSRPQWKESEPHLNDVSIGRAELLPMAKNFGSGRMIPRLRPDCDLKGQ